MSIAGDAGLVGLPIYTGHNGQSRCETDANNAGNAVQANCKRLAGHAGKTCQDTRYCCSCRSYWSTGHAGQAGYETR